MCCYQTAHDSLHYTTRHVHCVQRVLYAHSKYVHMGMYITHYVHSTPELICSGQWIWSNSHSLCQLRGMLHPTGQMDWVGPGKLRWLADEVVRNCVYPPWLLTLFYIPYLRRRDGVRPVLGVAIVARAVVDRARARALHHRRDHARLVSVPSVRSGLHPLSPAARSQSAITAGARSPIDAPSASPVPFVRAGFRRAGADSSSRFAVGGSGTSYW